MPAGIDSRTLSALPDGLTCSPWVCRFSGASRSTGRIDRHVLAGRNVGLRVEVVDRQALKIVVVVDDQPLARVDAQRRRGIQVVALGRTVRAGALDQLVAEHQEVGDRLGDGVEVDGALMRRQPDLEDAVLALQAHRLAEGRGPAVGSGIDARRRVGRDLGLGGATRPHEGHRDHDDDSENRSAAKLHSPPLRPTVPRPRETTQTVPPQLPRVPIFHTSGGICRRSVMWPFRCFADVATQPVEACRRIARANGHGTRPLGFQPFDAVSRAATQSWARLIHRVGGTIDLGLLG